MHNKNKSKAIQKTDSAPLGRTKINPKVQKSLATRIRVQAAAGGKVIAWKIAMIKMNFPTFALSLSHWVRHAHTHEYLFSMTSSWAWVCVCVLLMSYYFA